MPKLQSSSKFQEFVEGWLGWGVALALFGMMIITFCDVIGRKFLGSSIPGVVELTELLMLALIFLGLPLCSLRSEHVVFDLLDKFLPQFLAKHLHFISHAVCVLLLAGATWLVWERAVRTLSQGDITAQLQIPLAPFYYGTAILLGVTSLVHLYLAITPPLTTADGEISAGAL